ncbi:MAG: 4-hydroxythreonine-4-phosphate dehydrogenase PdxA [Elusimicrobiota bacterium]
MTPLLAVTPGDPSGIGPEVAVAAMRDPGVRRSCRVLAVGPRRAFESAGWTPKLAPLLDTGSGGCASYEAVRSALRLCRRGLAHGMVTAPISKQSWASAGVPYRDHTEMLAAETRSPRAGMWLEGGGLRAVLVTRHIPLRRVADALTPQALALAARLAHDGLLRLGVRRPRLGLCALNPHAGDGGLLGKEEFGLRRTAVRLRSEGVHVSDPLPADAAWQAHAAGRFDVLLALYHDQALIPLHLKAGFSIVNWTLGIPVVRTAPGHGTAFDIAGKGKADPSGMIAAVLHAARVSNVF